MRFSKPKSLFVLSIGCLSAALAAASARDDGSAAPPVIAGSDLLAGAVREGIPDALEIDMDGSLPGLNRLRQGDADLALIVLRPGSTPPTEPWVSRQIGTFVVSVVVNPRNPLNEISLDRLAGIFGRSEEFDFSQWGDLGLSQWGDRGIQKLVLAREAGLAQEMYRYLGLNRPHFKADITSPRSSRLLLEAVRGEANAIGLLGRVPADAGVKVLALAADRQSTPLLPDPQSVHFQDYPLQLPIFLVYPQSATEDLKAILLSFFRDGMARALENAGVLPLPRNVRSRIGLELEMMRDG